MSDTAFVLEDQIPEYLNYSKLVNACEWKRVNQDRRDNFQFLFNEEVKIIEMELSHRKIIAELEEKETTDYLGTLFYPQPEETNMWAAFQQVGPVPSVAPEGPSEFGIPFASTFFPYQGSKIYDWMQPEQWPVFNLWPVIPSPRTQSPPPFSGFADLDSEQDLIENIPSSSSSDSGLGSEACGSTAKKLEEYCVYTAEDIEKREKLVEEWKSLIEAKLHG